MAKGASGAQGSLQAPCRGVVHNPHCLQTSPPPGDCCLRCSDFLALLFWAFSRLTSQYLTDPPLCTCKINLPCARWLTPDISLHYINFKFPVVGLNAGRWSLRTCTSWQAPLAGCDRAAAGTPPCDHAAAGWVSSASGAPRFRPRSPRAAGPGYALVLPRAVRCQTRPVVGAALAGIYAARRWLQTPVADARLESPRHTSLQVRLPTSG